MQNFDDLAEMAGRGNSKKVDVTAGDLKNKEREANDWYSFMEDELHLFALGKMAESKYNGTYSGEDIAAALLDCYCRTIVKTIIPNAKLHKQTRVVFIGSFVSHPVVRRSMERNFYGSAFLEPFSGGDPIRMAVLPNPGFMCALGTWLKNVELERAETEKSAESLPNTA